MAAPETPDVWRECSRSSIRYMFTGGLILLAASAPLAIAVRFLTHIGWLVSFFGALYALVIPLTTYVLIKRLRDGWKQRGEIIWDFGPRPGRELWVLLWYFSLIMLIMLVIAILLQPVEEEVTTLIMTLYAFWGGVSAFVNSSGRLQFCTNGIWAYHKLLPWDTLEYFEWRKSDEWKHSALWVKYRRPAVGALKAILHIPNQSKEEVEELLRQHLQMPTKEIEESVEAKAQADPV